MLDDLISALEIFKKYISNNESIIHCEHDVMFVCILAQAVSVNDLEELDQLGFFPDEESGFFISYKFGSC